MKEDYIVEIEVNIEHDISENGTDWERLRNLSDEEIHAAALADVDALPTNEEFWKNAKLVMPKTKETITIRLDSDVLQWFKANGKNYQTRINSVLSSYMNAQVNH